jgi:chemotaxis protein MotB
MRCGKWIVGLSVGAWLFISVSGCVSLNDYRRVQALNRSLVAEKEALNQELFDTRNNTGSYQTRVDSLTRELASKDELIANLRNENEVLDEMRKTAQMALEEMASRQQLGDIAISAPMLPEQLDSALKRFADEHPSAVVYDPMHGTVKWKSDLLFALGSDVVRESSMDALRGFSDIVKSPAAKDFEVIVVGHTDTRPISRPQTKAKHPSNWHLSAHRAISVGKVLQKNGYTAERIGVMGYGEYRPVADNASEEGASQNRRVEMYLVPRGAIVPATSSAGWRVDGEALAFVRLVP